MAGNAGDQKAPLMSATEGQDVMVVVQCAPSLQLRTAVPAASAGACASIKAFADSVTKGRKSEKAFANGYVQLQPGPHATCMQQVVKQWRSQTLLLSVWGLSSLVVMLFVPLFVAPGALLLASMTGAALGVVAVLMHASGNRLAESGTFSVIDQIDTTGACATAAACIDLLAMALAVAWVWAGYNIPEAGLGSTDIMPLLLFACNCWQHGVVSVAVMQSMSCIDRE